MSTDERPDGSDPADTDGSEPSDPDDNEPSDTDDNERSDTDDNERSDVDEIDRETGGEDSEGTVRHRIENEAERARTEFDERLVDLLSWLLDTETRARIYVYLRQNRGSTSEEIAQGTGLYPSTVREALASLNEEGKVDRRKREASGAGNNPYEYTAMAPSDLVASVIGDVQDELNTVFNLDRHLRGPSGRSEADDAPDADDTAQRGPVSITVDEEDEEAEDTEDEAAVEDVGESGETEQPPSGDEPESD